MTDQDALTGNSVSKKEAFGDSLKKRYFYKLSTNFAGLCIGAVTQAVIPRGLGPKMYGDYNFLTNFFNQFVNFFDMGTSIGFYTKLSQRPDEFKLVSFYMYFMGIVTAVVGSFTVIAQLTSLHNILWPNQLSRYIYLALFLAIFVWVINIMTRIADAYGLTVSMELAKIFQKIIGFFLIIALFLSQRLFLGNFFLYNYIISFLLMAAFYYSLKKHGYSLLKEWRLALPEIKRYTGEFYAYSRPLALYSLVVMIAGMFDRWLLQFYSGSVEQGFFSLSYQIGAICFVFTSAMTPLITREFSIAYNNKNITVMAQLFRKHVPLLFAITAILACFTAINADKITIIMGGAQFRGAIIAVAIMAFFPMHQVYGQLSGSVFYASNGTNLYCKIGVIFAVLSLPITYFVIAPRSAFGLNSGAIGLASKTVLLQFFAVNTLLYFNAKLLGLRFWKYIAHQLTTIAAFLTLAILAKVIVSYFCARPVISFVFNGALYLAMAAVFIRFVPGMIGVKKGELDILLKRRWMRGKDTVN